MGRLEKHKFSKTGIWCNSWQGCFWVSNTLFLAIFKNKP